MKELSELYNATFKKNRGKAKEGYIRPTLSEFFTTNKDFVEIVNIVSELDDSIQITDFTSSYIYNNNWGLV